MLRLIDIETGSIFIDNVELRRFPRSVFRERSFITTPQDRYLFLRGTLRFNKDDVKNDCSDEQIIIILKEAHLWHML